jgi:lipopolysaccharide export system permease protein
MTLIDRHILWRFLASYLGSLLCMLLLYVVLDAFTRLDDFMVEAGELPPARVAQSVQGAGTTGHSAKVRASLLGFARNLGVYYAYRLPVIFDLVNSFVVLLAATFTLGWMEKQNELLPLLSAGVRMRRVFAPA